MLFIPPANPGIQDETNSALDPSRRMFLARLGTLFTTASFGFTARDAAAWDEPPPLERSPEYSPRRYDHPYRYDRPYRYPPPLGRQNHRAWREEPSYAAQPRNAVSDDLNITIQRYLTAERQASRVASNERTAWLVYDFTSRRFLATINAGIPYQSASMIKPFIALAFFYKVEDGVFQYTPFHRERMEAMIQYSDNRATNYFIELLNRTSRRSGPAEVEHTLKRGNPGVFRHTRIVEYIPRGGRTYRNRASALDYHRFLQALWYDQLPYSEELKRLLHLPNRDRVYTGAREIPRGTWVFDKTGTTARLCGDMGILVARGRDGRRYPYTFIGIIEKARPTRNYALWKNIRGDVIREVSNLTYNHLREMYDLV